MRTNIKYFRLFGAEKAYDIIIYEGLGMYIGQGRPIRQGNAIIHEIFAALVAAFSIFVSDIATFISIYMSKYYIRDNEIKLLK